MRTHVAFLRDAPLREVLAGHKRHEFRLSFGRLACEGVRTGDVLLLKRVGGEVEAACNVGEVCIYRDQPPERLEDLLRGYADATSSPYLRRYLPPRNRGRPVNAAIIELLNVRMSSLPAEATPRKVRSGWVADFDPGHEDRGERW